MEQTDPRAEEDAAPSPHFANLATLATLPIPLQEGARPNSKMESKQLSMSCRKAPNPCHMASRQSHVRSSSKHKLTPSGKPEQGSSAALQYKLIDYELRHPSLPTTYI